MIQLMFVIIRNYFFQIYVTSFFNHGRHFAVTFSQDLSFQVQNVWSQSWSGQVNIALQGFTNFIRDVTRHCSTVWAQPNQVVSQLAELATVESKFSKVFIVF